MPMQPFPFLIPSLLLLASFPTRACGENIWLLGGGPSLTLVLMPEAAGNGGSFQLLPALGVSLGYETHFLPELGIKAESRIFTGPTWINFDTDTSDQAGEIHTESFSGGKGLTSGLSVSGQLVVGPFSKLVLEPGLGITNINRSHTILRLHSDAHTTDYRSEARQTLLHIMVGVGMYLGSHDQFKLDGLYKMGFIKDREASGAIQWELNLAYAFHFPSR
ncbi:MAG: hypothetical protein ABIY63_13445 [Fibrobacteria bacterium]